jgi:hypothetical protein
MTVRNDDGDVRALGIPADLPAGHTEVKSAKVSQGDHLPPAKVINEAVEEGIYDTGHILMLHTGLVAYLYDQVFSNNTFHPAVRYPV